MAAPGTSLTSGPPMTALDGLLGGPLVDDLLLRAVRRAPDDVAVRSRDTARTYAELNEEVTRFAAAVHESVEPGEVVALASVLDPAFPLAFFGLCRAGAIPALVNPLLREEALAHVLATCAATVAIIPPELYPRLAAVRDRLPRLRSVLLTHRGHGTDPAARALPTVADLVAAGSGTPPPTPATSHDIACLQFTSGTTGPAKVVRLSHHNLVVNAAQTAHAQRLTATSVVFNYLPTFHLMHLTISVTAGASLVLWTGDDVAEAVEAADRFGATHFYSLPVRLSRLAADERLPKLRARALRTVLCGGSALPLFATNALSQQFGVPVAQGYGLQETSPSTHFDDLDAPTLLSSGRPVAGTDCRIVRIGEGVDREVLPVGEKGEIQVRGPQLMLGYHDRDRARVVDAEGWFSTGDVGYVDSSGRLFVSDRIKDVFKCDNWLVSPTEIERVLRRHPQVADCAVFDFPDTFSGAVAYALVVPRRVGGGEPPDPAGFAAYIAERLPYYEHLRDVELIDAIPRSPTGKVQRRELRARAVARTSPKPDSENRSASCSPSSTGSPSPATPPNSNG
ncbi:class I adenylate-forming enzyme family protein [Amycolatopsis silviterrae]|uniref:Class I adenylate-forming enzyme family protein n=1 Tax=Amycolatopsis silviterrae TaxID=1656914 RepID=A0ABW5H6H3_9PSEU